jgi:hypothetical protein
MQHDDGNHEEKVELVGQTLAQIQREEAWISEKMREHGIRGVSTLQMKRLLDHYKASLSA